MMHMRVAAAPELSAERGHYSTRGLDPVALGVVIVLHVMLLAAALTYRIAVQPPAKVEPLQVQTLDLAPPPAPDEPDQPKREPPPVNAPPPRLPLAPPAPMPVAITPEDLPAAALSPAAIAPPRVEPAPPAPRPPAPAQVSAGDLSSTMLEGAPPRYPMESRRKREQGTVTLLLLLGTDGRVAEIRVSRSSGHPRLDEAALSAVRRWRWSPTLRGGVAVQVRGTVEIPFVLTG